MLRHLGTVVLALGMALGDPAPAVARLLVQAVPTPEFQAGGFCVVPADGVQEAPATRDGTVDVSDLPYAFVVPGDEVPAAKGMGVGLVVGLGTARAGQVLTLQTSVLGEAVAPDTWRTEVGADGRFWFATVPVEGGALAPGIYRFDVFEGRALILSYQIWVKPSDPEGSCLAPVA